MIDIVCNLPTRDDKFYRQRFLKDIKQIIIHHSATSGGSPESFARYHVENKGWPGIGYHIVIDKNGNICKTNFATTISYHCSGQNHKSIGVCVIGNYDNVLPDGNILSSLHDVIKYYDKMLGVELPIKGHRDFKATSCPGDKLYEYIKNTFKRDEKR